jgi:hypothetical protein
MAKEKEITTICIEKPHLTIFQVGYAKGRF